MVHLLLVNGLLNMHLNRVRDVEKRSQWITAGGHDETRGTILHAVVNQGDSSCGPHTDATRGNSGVLDILSCCHEDEDVLLATTFD